MANLPRVALIITGGTIDSLGKDRLDLAWYIEAGKRLGDGELLQQLPELKSIAEVQEVPFRRLPSHALVDKDWLDLVRTIHSIFDQDKADGIGPVPDADRQRVNVKSVHSAVPSATRVVTPSWDHRRPPADGRGCCADDKGRSV